jgi:hypothetical protein
MRDQIYARKELDSQGKTSDPWIVCFHIHDDSGRSNLLGILRIFVSWFKFKGESKREYKKFEEEMLREEAERYDDDDFFSNMRYGKHRRKTDG